VNSPSATTLENNEKIRLREGAENRLYRNVGGETGIRTLGTLARSTVFETAPFDRSGISPLAGSHMQGGDSAQEEI
jgi:hypothetical protein